MLDKKTGAEIWKLDRDERTSWSTPIVVEHNGGKQVIISATNRIRIYALENGELIWACGGMTRNVVPTPVLSDGILYFASGLRGNALIAVRLDAVSGDITDSEAILWKSGQNTPYVPSLLVYGDLVCSLLENKGTLTCFDAKTGKEHYSRQMLEGIKQIHASPLGASERVYLIGRNGVMLVLRRSSEFGVLAQIRCMTNSQPRQRL